MNYSAKNIAAFLNLETENLPNPDSQIHSVQIDSRIITAAEKTLFVALVTGKGNGHLWIQDAYEKGVRNFLVQEDIEDKKYMGANFFKVSNCLESVQILARIHRQNFQIPIVGVTGSNGKTIVKEWLSFLLSEKFYVLKNPGSFNSQIGVPLSIFPLDDSHEIGIFEAGISQPGEMEKLSEMIHCSIGIFTHLGPAHDEGFTSEDEKMKEKARLFQNAHTLIYPLDNEVVRKHLNKLNGKKYCWSWHKKDVFCQILNIDKKFDGTQLEMIFDGEKRSLWIPFQSSVQIENSISAIIAAYLSGIPFSQLSEQASKLPEVDMRLSLTKGIKNSLVVNDYYNADLHGLEAALDFMSLHANSRKKILLLSELSHTRLTIEEIYQIIQNAKEQGKFDIFIGIGNAWKKVLNRENAKEEYCFSDTREFLDNFDFEIVSGAIILLKGARQFRFEKISQYLRLQEHTARLEINLSTLKSNLDFFRTQLSPGTKLMAMVKASAYGSGSPEVSRVLAYNQVDYLCVAYIDEGIELRRQGISVPILVLNAESQSFQQMAQYSLEPEVYKKSQLSFLEAMENPPAIHLKLDTGMNRLGFKDEDLEEIGKILKKSKLKVKSLFSHLAASEDPDEDNFSHKQAKEFLMLCEKICSWLGYQPFKHLLNTNGIIRFPQYHFDMIRLGIGLYGLGLGEGTVSEINSIFSLKASISQIKRIGKGETVGYGRKMKAEEAMTIGVINIGYADGLLRKAGNGNFSVLLKDKKVPTVGNICMDMCMIDLSDCGKIEEGQMVEIFSDSSSIIELAKSLETIPYEILTNISARIPRIYLRD